LSADLATRLKLATQALHTEVERAGAMAALLQGRLERPGYARLLRNLHALYAALEPALAAHGGHPLIAPLDTAPLARAGALADDLAVLHGPRWADELPLDASAAAYAERLAAADAPALVAHAYVRYLGDLSGGQVLRRLVAQRYGLAGDAGTRFYDFGDAARAAALKQRFRAALAALAPAEAVAEAIVDEACWAFRQHGRLFEALAAPA
jgi:heme oxygenase (biliverdin-producing, ferredoxin)